MIEHFGRTDGEPPPSATAQPAGPVVAVGKRAIAIGGSLSGIASTGDNATNVQQFAEQAAFLPPEAFAQVTEVVAPAKLVNLPVRPGMFVGRTAELERLNAALAGPNRGAVLAVHGLGGTGKSTLAAHWASTQATSYNPIWWITAGTPASIDAALAALTVALQPALSYALSLEALTERAVQWLSSHRGWLLILDNVNNPSDIAQLLARVPTGRFVITSRRATGWHNLAQAVRLDVLKQTEAVDLLTGIIGGQEVGRDLDGAGELCAELGFLPLAVEQVGAYIAETGITPRAYLEMLVNYPATMYQATAEGGDAQRTIARIWNITLNRLVDTPLAGDLLRIMAWYAPNAIPRMLLDGLDNPPALTQAIGRLAAYSMLTPDAVHNVLAVHRLVQAVTRTPDPDDPHRQASAIDRARDRATSQLSASLPANWQDPAGWPTWRSLLPHVDALADRATADTDTITTDHLLSHSALFLFDQGIFSRAIEYIQRALHAKERLLGADHPGTLTSRNNLAAAYQMAGKLSQAIQLHEQTLAHRQRTLGDGHPDTLASWDNLASAYQAAGDLGRAIPLHEQTLADRQRIQGEDHSATLKSRNNLAIVYEAAGDLDRAIPLFEQTLADRRRTLGEDHPDTLTSRSNLAAGYLAAGDLSRAIPLFEQTLADRRRTLGEDHPGTLASGTYLADAYKQAGDLDRAMPLYTEILADAQRLLGEYHPQTLVISDNLAEACKQAGNLAQAIRLGQMTVNGRLRVLGADHPDTLRARDTLAIAYDAAGDLDRAIREHEQVLADRLRVLGAHHPDTLNSRNSLAHALGSSGDFDRAVELYEQALADARHSLTENHPTTLTICGNLAFACLEAGNLARAMPLFEQSLADRLRVLGEDHPLTLAARNHLARGYHAAGNLGRAIPLYEQTLADRLRLLGPGHPDTLVSHSNLAVAYDEADDLDRAIPMYEQNLADRLRILGPSHPDTLLSRSNLAGALADRDRRKRKWFRKR